MCSYGQTNVRARLWKVPKQPCLPFHVMQHGETSHHCGWERARSYEAPMHLQALQISQCSMQTRQSAQVRIKPQINRRSMSAMNSRIRNELERKSCQATNPNQPKFTGGAERRRRSKTNQPKQGTRRKKQKNMLVGRPANGIGNLRMTAQRLRPAPLSSS